MYLSTLISRAALGLGALVLLATSTAPAPASGPIELTAVQPASAPGSGRLVVWDAARRGVDIRAGRLDGSEERSLYRAAHGYVSDLALSRDGGSVAFSTFAGRRAQLVVAATDGSGHTDLLRRHRQVKGVGVIGWAPDGDRLAFEGFVDEPGPGRYRPAYLFTVTADGTRLRRLQRLTGGGTSPGSGTVAWTRRGIVYNDDYRIRLLTKDGRRRTLPAGTGVVTVRPSGDGRWVFYLKVSPDGAGALHRMRPTGRDRQVVARGDDRWGDLVLWSPDHRGARVLVQRELGSGPLVAFNVTRPRMVRQAPSRGSLNALTWR